MDTKAYLERIHYKGLLHPTIETLRDLQLSHLLSVPFENLSIHAKELIILQEDSLFDKIVFRQRGGFCYELNGLFASLLRQLGFNVTLLSAGVAKAGGGFGPDFDHMSLMVLLEDRWLVDVGFGDSFRQPLLVDRRDIQEQGKRSYQLCDEDNRFILKENKGDGNWETQYRFTLQPHELVDFAEMCQYHQTSPESIFTQRLVCSKAKPDGRVTLSDMRLIETNDSKRQERVIKDEEERKAILIKEFGVIY